MKYPTADGTDHDEVLEPVVQAYEARMQAYEAYSRADAAHRAARDAYDRASRNLTPIQAHALEGYFLRKT